MSFFRWFGMRFLAVFRFFSEKISGQGRYNSFPDYLLLRIFIMTTDYLLQNRNGIKHVNILSFMKDGNTF